MSNLIGAKGVGSIVTFVSEYHDLIIAGAGSLEEDVYNQVTYIS
jgi:hypothetical protein